MTIERADGDSLASIELDTAYAKALAFAQQGLWPEAAQALAELDRRHPGSAEALALSQRLAYHLSAEETWSAESASRLPPPLRPAGVRILLLGNLVVYVLLAVGWLVGEWTGLLSQATLP